MVKVQRGKRPQNPRKGKGKKVAKLSTPMKNAIVKVFHQNTEDKYASVFPGAGGCVNPGAPWSGNPGAAIFETPNIVNTIPLCTIYPCLPPVLQGVSAFQRLGDKISPKSLVMKFAITVNPAVTGPMDLVCRLLCLSDKGIKETDLLVTSPVNPGTPIDTQLLDNGDGTYVGFTGVPRNVTMKVNRARYTVHHDRLIRITKGLGDLGYIANVYVGNMVYTSTTMSHELSLRIPLPKTLNYAQNTFNYPANAAPFWCIGYVQPSGDGSAAQGVALNNHVLVNYTSHFSYEDA